MLTVRHLREKIPIESGMFCFPNPSLFRCLVVCYMFDYLVCIEPQLIGLKSTIRLKMHSCISILLKWHLLTRVTAT